MRSKLIENRTSCISSSKGIWYFLGSQTEPNRFIFAGNDFPRNRHSGDPPGVDPRKNGPPPRNPIQSPIRNRRRCRKLPTGFRFRHPQPSLPSGDRERISQGAPTGTSSLLGSPRHPRRFRGVSPNPGGNDRHGQHVGHHPRREGLARPSGIQTRAIHGQG